MYIKLKTITDITTNAKYNMNNLESVYNAFANSNSTNPSQNMMNISNKFPKMKLSVLIMMAI